MNREILKWIKSWDKIVFGNETNNNTLDQKVILLSGPPGIF
jgi:hypothetical protein